MVFAGEDCKSSWGSARRQLGRDGAGSQVPVDPLVWQWAQVLGQCVEERRLWQQDDGLWLTFQPKYVS